LDADSILVSVRTVNERGCGYEGEEWVYVWRDFWAPDAFSPNGDKLNDTFRFFAEDYIYKFTFVIFNRLGEIVFTGQSSHDEWDGTYLGQPCPWGVYGWVVKYKSDYKGVQKEGEKRGFVSLIR
jgi:gliding motility-associated-like protein